MKGYFKTCPQKENTLILMGLKYLAFLHGKKKKKKKMLKLRNELQREKLRVQTYNLCNTPRKIKRSEYSVTQRVLKEIKNVPGRASQLAWKVREPRPSAISTGCRERLSQKYL